MADKKSDDFEETPEDQIDNDEISPEEEGFMKGYEDSANNKSEFDINTDD